MKENKQVKSTNMLLVYDRLRQSPVTLDVLYDWVKKSGIDVSRRTLYRYLNGLASSIHFHGEKLMVYTNEFNKKVWKIEFDESAKLLNQFDINSYYILRNFSPRSLTGPREASLKKLDELIYGLSSKSNFQLNVDANNLAFIRTNYNDVRYDITDHKLLEDLIFAIQQHRKVKVEKLNWDVKLFPEGFNIGMALFPLKLVYHNGLVYLCVYAGNLDKIVILPVNNIIETSLTNDSFSPSLYYRMLDEYLNNTFGILPNYDNNVYDIEIEVAGTTGNYVSTMHWHDSQVFVPLPNGNMLMRLRCGINRDLIGFIMYYLNNAKVLKPNKLKNMVVQKLHQILHNYNTDGALVYQSNLAGINGANSGLS